MASPYLTLGIGAVLGAALSLVIATPSASSRELAARRTSAEPAEPRAGSGVQGSGDANDKRTERELDLAALRQVAFRQALSAEPAAPAEEPRDPLAAACSTLDQRLQSAANPAEASRLERSLRGVVDSAAVGTASATITCGSTMCRVELADADDAGVNQAVSAVLERLPKSFASTVIYPRGSGERAMYVATNPSDLKLGPDRTGATFTTDSPPPAAL